MLRSPCLYVLFVACLVLGATAVLRGAEYDEQYTLFVTAGVPRPDWPAEAFYAADVTALQAGHASLAGIARDLRTTDVHPPLYFWALALWRRTLGDGLLVARLASVLSGVLALAMVGVIARQALLPASLSMLLTLGCYGFAYTSAIARGFAFAQALTLLGIAILIQATRRRRTGLAGLAGLVFGTAVFSNYLAGFVAGAAVIWVMFRDGRVCVAALAGLAVWLPPTLWFLTAQRNARTGQFPPFELLPDLIRLARYAAASVLGGLPLYVPDHSRTAVTLSLAAVLLVLIWLVFRRWNMIATPSLRVLFALAAMAPPVGLLTLGALFDNAPIELRYLAFATPFIGLLMAGALSSSRQAALLVLALQAVSLAGSSVRPETMQPARATARAAAAIAGDGIVVLPRGNDGVGIVGAFAVEAPAAMRLLVVPRSATAASVRDRALGYSRVTLALIGQDADSRATLPTLRAAFAPPCWREAGLGFNVVAYERVTDAC